MPSSLTYSEPSGPTATLETPPNGKKPTQVLQRELEADEHLALRPGCQVDAEHALCTGLDDQQPVAVHRQPLGLVQPGRQRDRTAGPDRPHDASGPVADVEGVTVGGEPERDRQEPIAEQHVGRVLRVDDVALAQLRGDHLAVVADRVRRGGQRAHVQRDRAR